MTEQCDDFRQIMRENQQRQDNTLRDLMTGLHIGLPDQLQQPDVAGPSGSSAPGGSGFGYRAPFYIPGDPEFVNAEPYRTYEQRSKEEEDEEEEEEDED